MARKTVDDCRCELQRNHDTGGYDVLKYNPRCPFHKGPDAGYGYDEWGRPNTKYSQLGGVIVAVSILVILMFLGCLAFGVFG